MIKLESFKSRRTNLLKALDQESVAIVFSAKEHDPHRSYRQNPDFYYLTGFIEPEAIAVLAPNHTQGEFILFIQESDPKSEVWHGKKSTLEQVRHEFGVDQVFPISAANEILPNILNSYKNIYSNSDYSNNFDPKITAWLNHRPHQLLDLGKILHQMRLIKCDHELSLIRKAAEITAEGHLRAMQKCRPGMYEYELEAELLHEFTKLGSRETAFPSIIAGGANACTLHYDTNSAKLKNGELVLIDAGAKYGSYSADVSRTFPINGKFTQNQKELYEIVLSAQYEVIKKIKPGVSWDFLQQIAEHTITDGLLKSGLLEGEWQRLVEQRAFEPFFMHKIGHWLGLDTHDVGEYYINDKWQTLEPGMFFTVEPGVYVSPLHPKVDAKWLGTGIRIEDNILVTKDGCEILTGNIPKETSQIEKIMSR